MEEGSSDYPRLSFRPDTPIELAEEIMLSLDRRDIHRICRDYPRFRAICDDPYFWRQHKAQQYLREYYASRRAPLRRRWREESSGESRPVQYGAPTEYIHESNLWG